ncbi:MAG: MFS transporter [Novosphingobium sp.]
MNGAVKTAGQEWRENWTLVMASSVGFCFFSVMLGTTGLFMQPVTAEFGWGRAFFASGVSIATFTTAIISPFLGIIVDKWGARRLAIPGVLLTMVSMALFGLTNGTVMWIGLWLFFGVASACIKSTVWTVAVLGVFTRSKGLALAVVVSGTAIAQVIVPPLGNFLIAEYGWRSAYFWLGVGWGLPTFALAFFFFFDLHDVAARQRAKDQKAAEAAAAVNLPGLTVPEASRDWALWRVGISNFVVMVLTQGLMAHLIPILTDAGVSRTNAALLTSLGGVAGIVGKLTTGVLLDRFRPNWIGGVTLGAAALTFLFLMEGLRSPAAIVFALIVNGYAAGTKTQITGYLTASYGGMKSFGVVYGVMAAGMAAAAGAGPLLAGLVFDKVGNYAPFLLAGAIGCTLGGILIISLPSYPKFDKKEEPAADAFA